jgi:hypothetical protein
MQTARSFDAMDSVPSVPLEQPQQIQVQHMRSRFIGVNWCKRGSKWKVNMHHEGRQQHLGSFAIEQEEAAARAYDAKARELRGSAAHSATFKLNFPTAQEQRNRSLLFQQPRRSSAASDIMEMDDDAPGAKNGIFFEFSLVPSLSWQNDHFYT